MTIGVYELMLGFANLRIRTKVYFYILNLHTFFVFFWLQKVLVISLLACGHGTSRKFKAKKFFPSNYSTFILA